MQIAIKKLLNKHVLFIESAWWFELDILLNIIDNFPYELILFDLLNNGWND